MHMDSSSQSCGVCDLRHINKPSIVWCTECDEGLCTECQEHHSLSKGTRNHKTIAYTEYQKLPSDVLRITQNCSTHQEKFIIYCRKHERPCCRKCIVESHKECRDIENLDDVIQHVKTSNAVYEIEETLVEVAENLQKIHQHQQGNLATLKEKRKQIQKEIQKARTTINNHLNKLQEDLIKQLYAVEEKENSKIRQLLSTLEKTEKEILDNQRNIANIKQHATDLQLFLSIKQIEEDVCIKDEFLNSLVRGEGLKLYGLKYKINTAIQNIISDIKSFGDVHIEAKQCEIVLSRKKTKQAQIIVPTVESSSIENIKLKINKTIQHQGKYVFGCCLLPNGRTVFTYYNEFAVRVFSNEGIQDFEVKIPCYPFDIVYNSEDNTLAVTSGGSREHCIIIIDLKKKQIKKTISLDSNIYGIALKDNRLMYSAEDKGIQMINPYDESISDIVRDKMPSNCYIATFEHQTYQTNSLTNTVNCYDQHGKSQWTFHNESILRSPRGISVDTIGNLYVTGVRSRNVVVISPDGRRYREVLATSDCPSEPFSLFYNNSKKQLLVANCEDEAQLFDFI
ncbi:uncharacterized protein LOC127705577 [Mytilus californianus]|uniref:uncharacterized protein LOC127705577 n=1 Tax=Mytilus californianus TaxID=6549 RepID=UPI0022457367|nr:uncharacterized protein LOC127705577 [Mytilus californianus]